jgi:hypothetical protein
MRMLRSTPPDIVTAAAVVMRLPGTTAAWAGDVAGVSPGILDLPGRFCADCSGRTGGGRSSGCSPRSFSRR